MPTALRHVHTRIISTTQATTKKTYMMSTYNKKYIFFSKILLWQRQVFSHTFAILKRNTKKCLNLTLEQMQINCKYQASYISFVCTQIQNCRNANPNQYCNSCSLKKTKAIKIFHSYNKSRSSLVGNKFLLVSWFQNNTELNEDSCNGIVEKILDMGKHFSVKNFIRKNLSVARLQCAVKEHRQEGSVLV